MIVPCTARGRYTGRMALQIFGTRKSSDTRKAERFFKERGVSYQFVDLAEKGISPGELRAVNRAVGREELIDSVETGGVATYLGEAQEGNVNLFI